MFDRYYENDELAVGAANTNNNLNALAGWTATAFAFVVTGCGSIHATYWDAQIDELCRKDGGVTVYERVMVTPEELRKWGGTAGTIRVLPQQSAPADAPYVAKETTSWLNRDPDVFRRETLIVRTRDNKVLSRQVNYGRVRFEFGQPHSCQNAGTRLDVEHQTFQ